MTLTLPEFSAILTRCVVICAISTAAACGGCSGQKTSSTTSKYKPATEGPKANQPPRASSLREQPAPTSVAAKDSGKKTASDPLSDAQAVQNEIRTLYTALYSEDVDTVLRFTHPKIIELLGGQSQARVELKAMLSKTMSIGMSVESLTFPEPPTFLQTEANEFVIVPTLSIISANGKRMESLNFQLGTREIGTSKWVYIEESRISQQNVRDFIPDFPAKYEFPKFYRKKI